MEILAPDRSGVARAVAHLTAGRIVVIPTETLYGLAALATSPAAVAVVGRSKGRAVGAPLPVLVPDLAAAEDLAWFDDPARRLAARLWPGPLTLALPARRSLPDALLAGDGTVGLRVSAHPVAAELTRRCGPLTGTSANPTGQAPPSCAEQVAAEIRAVAAALIDAGATADSVPSTVVRVAADGAVEVLRRGAISAARLREILERP